MRPNYTTMAEAGLFLFFGVFLFAPALKGELASNLTLVACIGAMVCAMLMMISGARGDSGAQPNSQDLNPENPKAE